MAALANSHHQQMQHPVPILPELRNESFKIALAFGRKCISYMSN